jgi:anti-anti-sigma factor
VRAHIHAQLLEHLGADTVAVVTWTKGGSLMMSRTAEPGGYRIVHPQERAVVIELLGEHDLNTMEKLHRVMGSLAASNDVVIIDLDETEFLDSTVLKELLRAERITQEHGGRFVLNANGQPVVRKVLEVSGLLEHFEFVDNWDAALR